jgi:hypothetical protein
VSTTFLTGAGTLAALGGSISVKPGATELLIQDVSGKGTFSAGNKPITLSGSSQIKVEGTTSVYFDGVGSIASANYSIGNAAGTLSTDKTYILTADGIIGSNGIKATLKHIGEDNADGKIIIAVSDSKVLTITDVNIDLNSTTGGSISLGSGSAGIILNGAGSITTGASGVHTLAWGGTIYTDYADSGSLAAGSIAGYSAGGSISAAGSIGTTSGNFITQNGSFAILDMGITADVIQTALQKASTTPTAAVSQANGSIAVFQLSN